MNYVNVQISEKITHKIRLHHKVYSDCRHAFMQWNEWYSKKKIFGMGQYIKGCSDLIYGKILYGFVLFFQEKSVFFT